MFVWVRLPCGHEMYQRSPLLNNPARTSSLPISPCETCGADYLGTDGPTLWVDEGDGPRPVGD